MPFFSIFDCQWLEENFLTFDMFLGSFLSSSGMRSFSIYTSNTRAFEETTRLFLVKFVRQHSLSLTSKSDL